MLRKRTTLTLLAGLGLAAATLAAPASAVPVNFEVFAYDNSTSGGGAALDTGIDLAAGNRLVSTVDPLDCWSAGPDNRNSNANGLDGLSPAPCQPTGDHGFHSQDGETFRYGALVGRIGAGDWFLLGTSFDNTVTQTGRLFLAYWDADRYNNFGSVTARVDVNARVVALPGTLLLAGLGVALLVGVSRRQVLA